MGIPQSDLPAISKSAPIGTKSDPRRVLCYLRVPSKTCHPPAQRSCAGEATPHQGQKAMSLRPGTDPYSLGHLESGRVSVVCPAQGPAAPLDALGQQALCPDGQLTEGALVDQSG